MTLASWHDVFEPTPEMWGLRGDPFAWFGMRAMLGTRSAPESMDEAITELRAAFREITGAAFDERLPDQVQVAALAHGGMSSGVVDVHFWRQTAMPLLERRVRIALEAAEAVSHPSGVSDARIFSPFVCERLRYYVYLLRDPRNGQVFYIGKGLGNRVFAHAAAALDTATSGDKLNRIRDIRADGHAVQAELLRFGLTEKEAFEVEATMIQWVGLVDLTNIVSGHDVRARGRMSTDNAIALFDAPPIDLADIDEPMILFKIPRLWHPSLSGEELYEAVHGWWKLSRRRERARYAAAVSAGVIRGVLNRPGDSGGSVLWISRSGRAGSSKRSEPARPAAV